MEIGIVGGPRESFALDEPAVAADRGPASQAPRDSLDGPAALDEGGPTAAVALGKGAVELAQALGEVEAGEADAADVRNLATKIERYSGAVGTVATWTQLAGLGLDLPNASRDLREALDGHVANPTPESARALKAAMEGWTESMRGASELIPMPAVQAEVAGLLEVANRVIGEMAVTFADYADHHTRTAQGKGTMREVAAPAREEAPSKYPLSGLEKTVEKAFGAWQQSTGIEEPPPRVSAALERTVAAAKALEANREEKVEAVFGFGLDKKADVLLEELAEGMRELRSATLEASGNTSDLDLAPLWDFCQQAVHPD